MATKKQQSTNSEFSYELEKKENSKVVLTITVSSSRFSNAKEAVYNRLAKDTKISGFRPGKAPRQMIEAKLGARLFEDAINLIIPETTASVMEDAQIRPLERAEYKVKELKPDGSFSYTAEFTIFPEIKLPDLKKIKLKKDKVEVTDKEVDKLFSDLKLEIKQAIAARKNKENSANKAETDKVETDKKETDEIKPEDIKDSEIDWKSELNMDNVSTEDDVKKIIRRNLEHRKLHEVEEKFSADFIKEVLKQAKVEAPESLVNQQLTQREHDYTSRIEQLGLNIEDFLKTQQTDIDTLRNSWRDEVEFQIATDILFMSVAEQHNLQVSREEVEAELAKIEDAKTKMEYETEQGRNNIATVLLRQKSMEKLEELAGIEKHDHKHEDDSEKSASKSKESKDKN